MGRAFRLQRSTALAVAVAVLVTAGLLAACGSTHTGSPSERTATTPFVSEPASLVDTFDGTGTGATNPGSIGEFPGADVPFGMIQWSPDTYPDRLSGSGYSYSDNRISGLSLTHLSGDGCPAYGDIPILPTSGAIGADPAATTETFSHSHESAAPGRYSVLLGPAGVEMAVSVTTRTGISEITFPRSGSGNILFKVAGSANPVSASDVSIAGDEEVTGQVSSGQFCQTGTSYTLYFAARFDRSFSAEGTWSNRSVDPGSERCNGDACGAYVSFDTTADRTVGMKVGISFVSVGGAEANLDAEDPGWSLQKVENEATSSWNDILGRIRVGGGTGAEQRIFYTELYHSLLHPNVISDANGDYTGDDQKVHKSNRPQYSNFSEWDIYRSEIQLLSMVAPSQTADMIQSLVDDAQQNGWLPKWAIADGDAIQMNGDSADPIIASAYAFGIHDFDVGAALSAMVKGAEEDESGHGLEIERQYLDQYISQHYVGAKSLDLSSIDYSIGGSVTLEYAVDDFSIAQLAQSVGDMSVYEEMMQRAHNWEYLFDPAAGYLQARNSDGSFPPGPAFQKDLFEPGGEQGFEEGNAIQYSWSVPQDLAALADLMGGDAAADSKLTSFFSQLNAGRFEPYDWAGNEPNLWSPWEFDYFGAAWQTQKDVRAIATTLYHDAPVNEPGNDDLGAISSWYVWAAIGLYPVTPATATLAVASPLFPEVSVELPDGRRIEETAPGAAAASPYVRSLTVTGVSQTAKSSSAGSCGPAVGQPVPASGNGNWDTPWLPSEVLRTGANLEFALGSTPDRTWGAEPGEAPPSYGTGVVPAVGYTLPGGSVTLEAGHPEVLTLGIRFASGSTPEVSWTASTTSGLSVSTSKGVLSAGSQSPGGPGSCSNPPPVTGTVELTPRTGAEGAQQVRFEMKDASTGQPLPPVVLDVRVRPSG